MVSENWTIKNPL